MQLKAVFLCAKLSGYFVNCIQQLQQFLDVEVRVYHLPGDLSAPFVFENSSIEFILIDGQNSEIIMKSVDSFQPSIIYVSGWVYKEYLKVCKAYVKRGIVVICGLDNIWRGTLKQRALALGSPLFIKPYFTHIWAAGTSQYYYARKLGFKPKQILIGVYAGDVESFSSSRVSYSKVLLYVGRLEPIKGVDILYNTFLQLSDFERNGWKLRLIGNGSLSEKIVSTDNVIVESFKQPDKLVESTKDVGAFVLPSLFEPWGVAVHEFAARGLALILSDNVQSAEKYLIDGYNGYIFESGDKNTLRSTLIKLFRSELDFVETMGKRSNVLATHYTPELWAAKFLSLTTYRPPIK